MEATHRQLIAVCIGFRAYLHRARRENKQIQKWLPDCSCGCKYYHELSGKAHLDWGVCWNKKSPRAGKLTFEHMEKCRFFVQQDDSRGK